MNIAQIWQNALDKTQTSINNYPLDSSTIIDVNYIYHDFCNEIRALNENYFYHRDKLDTVAFKSQYTLPVGGQTTIGFSKMLSIGVKYQESTFQQWLPNTPYQKGEMVQYLGLDYIFSVGTPGDATFPVAFVQQKYVGYVMGIQQGIGPNIPEGNGTNIPLYNDFYASTNAGVNPTWAVGAARDETTNQFTNCLYLNPPPPNTVRQGILIDYIKTITDLTTTSSEADIQIEREYHYVLVEGIKWQIYDRTARDAQAQEQRQLYERARDHALGQIMNKQSSFTLVTTPSDPTYCA